MEAGDDVNISTRAIRAEGCEIGEDAPSRAEETVGVRFGDPGTELDQRNRL